MQKSTGRSSSRRGPFVPPAGLPIRGLAPEETAHLLRRFRSSGARVLRFVGILFGLGAVFLAITDFAGFPYDPDVIPWEVLIVGILAAGCAGAGAGMVRDLRPALETGQVGDLSAPLLASPSPPPPGFDEFQFGPLLLQIPKRRLEGLLPGANVRLCFAFGLKPVANRQAASLFPERALLLSVNGVLRDHPAVVNWRSLVTGAGWAGGAPMVPPVQFPPTASSSAPTLVPPGAAGSTGAVFCDQCGQENAPGFQFCRRCGARRTAV